jgi:uracil-DNA glycosylase
MRLEESWLSQLSADLEQPYMQHLRQFLAAEKRAGKRIFPRDSEIFSAFSSTPLDTVKVVILGQDPYHGEGQAHGLCFSVKPGVKVPPSLLNIYKELHANLGIAIPDHGNLESWAKQGVLLLNSVLSVECGLAASHQGKGWEQFTDRVIEVINHRLSGVVFMLWGNYAHRKGAMVDRTKHCVLQAPHPSPLSAYRGFFGCDHFSTANDYLRLRGTSPIDWSLKQVQLA